LWSVGEDKIKASISSCGRFVELVKLKHAAEWLDVGAVEIAGYDDEWPLTSASAVAVECFFECADEFGDGLLLPLFVVELSYVDPTY
jgi:hypothetical protein